MTGFFLRPIHGRLQLIIGLPMLRRPGALHILALLLLLLGTGAVYGGGALMLRSDGSLLGMPVTLLDGSCFADFFIPGSILFVVLGMWPLATAYALYTRPDWGWAARLTPYRDLHWAWGWAMANGCATVCWIAVQLAVIRMFDPLQTAFALLGAAIMAIAALPSVRQAFAQPDHPLP